MTGRADCAAASVPGTEDGEWVTPAVSYVDPVRRSCELCGRPIARRYWRVIREGRELVYCQPEHARLSATYPRSSAS
jgi:hypothetical protein